MYIQTYIHTCTYVYSQHTIAVLKKSLHVDPPKPRQDDGLGTRLSEDGLSQWLLIVILDEHFCSRDAGTYNHLCVEDTDRKIRLASDSITPFVCGAGGIKVRCGNFVVYFVCKILQGLAHAFAAVEGYSKLGDKRNADVILLNNGLVKVNGTRFNTGHYHKTHTYIRS